MRVVLLLLVLVLAATQTAALDYVESSQGLIPPSMDGGRSEVEFADVDDDGNVDLVSIGDHGSPYINTDQHGIMVWFGDGAGNWSVVMTGNFGYGGIAIGDIDNDGFWDAAYAMHHDYSATDFGDQLIEAALGDGTGQSWTPYDDGLGSAGETYGMFGTDLADIDNDGDLDIGSASFGCCAGVHVYRNEGDGTWTHVWGFLGGNSSMDFCFADMNADGFQDLIVAHDAGTVYLGDGSGSFENADANLPGAGNVRVTPTVGDIDNDGDLDLAYRGFGGSLQVWLYAPGSDWVNASAGLPTSGISAVEIDDMDGDGFCDLVALGSNSLRVWLGDGGANWTLDATIPLPASADLCALRAGGDVDHNGLADIAVISEQGSWPSYNNVFRVFRESSQPSVLAARFAGPRGREAFVGGSIRFVDWLAAVPGGDPAEVALDLSIDGAEGPWTEIASGLPNGGRFQWRVPVVPETDDARLRVRLVAGGEEVEAITPASFSILSPTAASVSDLAVPARFTVHPNPSVGGVRLEVPRDAARRPVRILDLRGRLVRLLEPGVGEWDARDREGRPVPAGVYHAAWGQRSASFVILR